VRLRRVAVRDDAKSVLVLSAVMVDEAEVVVANVEVPRTEKLAETVVEASVVVPVTDKVPRDESEEDAVKTPA
jgi:hypothetical protein